VFNAIGGAPWRECDAPGGAAFLIGLQFCVDHFHGIPKGKIKLFISSSSLFWFEQGPSLRLSPFTDIGSIQIFKIRLGQSQLGQTGDEDQSQHDDGSGFQVPGPRVGFSC